MIPDSLHASLAVLLLFAVVSSADSPDPLQPHRWKHRILVLHVSDHSRGKQVLASWEASLRQEKSGLVERDILVLYAGPHPGKTPGYVVPLTDVQRAVLRQQLRLDGPEPQVVLIGKDGTVKRRQRSERLDLAALFALIDTMPMRQEEMRRK